MIIVMMMMMMIDIRMMMIDNVSEDSSQNNDNVQERGCYCQPHHLSSDTGDDYNHAGYCEIVRLSIINLQLPTILLSSTYYYLTITIFYS